MLNLLKKFALKQTKKTWSSAIKLNFTPFLLEDLYNQYEGKYEHNLSSAMMPAMSIDDLLEYYSESERKEFQKELFQTKLDYSAQFGLEKTRKALVKNLYPSLKEEDFLLTTGASEAIYLVMNTLFKKGDTILVQKPIYQSLYQIAEDKGVHVIDWDLDLDTMTWDLDQLKKLVKENSEIKALIINNPNNPVGTVFSEEELLKISKLLNGRYLISDEVFNPISLKPTKPVAELYEYGISISDLSKSFNMPGLRLGWIAIPSSGDGDLSLRAKRSNPLLSYFRENNLDKLSSYKNYLSLRNNSLSEIIAPWLLNKTQEITSKNKKTIQENIDWLYSQKPGDLFFDLSQKKENIASLCFMPKLNQEMDLEDMISKGFFFAPGACFGDKYQEFTRIGLANSACYYFLKCKQ